MSDRLQHKRRDLVLVGTLGMLIPAALLTVMSKHGMFHLTGLTRILVGTIGTTCFVLWWGLFMIRITRAQDEYQRWREHRAWYIGGLIGLMASVPMFSFIGLGGLHWLNPETDAGPVAARAFTNGYMLPLMMQVLGSTGFAIWDRFAKR